MGFEKNCIKSCTINSCHIDLEFVVLTGSKKRSTRRIFLQVFSKSKKIDTKIRVQQKNLSRKQMFRVLILLFLKQIRFLDPVLRAKFFGNF